MASGNGKKSFSEMFNQLMNTVDKGIENIVRFMTEDPSLPPAPPVPPKASPTSGNASSAKKPPKPPGRRFKL